MLDINSKNSVILVEFTMKKPVSNKLEFNQKVIDNSAPRILFLGTPDFAVESLKQIVQTGYNVVGVISQPDRETDRKGNLLPTAVKAAASGLGLQVYQFDSVNKNIDVIKSLSPDLMVTAAFGQILGEDFLKIAPVFNVHASLLPLYRGSSPIQNSIINADTHTGVTIMRTVRAMDAGDIVIADKVKIESSDTYGLLHDKLSLLGAGLIVKAIGLFKDKKITYTPQDENKATHVVKVNKADGNVNWSQSAEIIARRVRAYNPWPSCYTKDNNGNVFKIHVAKVVNLSTMSDIINKNAFKNAQNGTILLADAQNGLFVKCGVGVLSIENIQASGKRALPVKEFLRGYNFEIGAKFGC